jgi:hypothetical protein
MRFLHGLFALGVVIGQAAALRAESATFVFTSDVHFGIARGTFRGEGNVSSRVVNTALVAKMNHLPAQSFPNDSGLRAGERIGAIDFVVITGDIANRMELYPLHIQTAEKSWSEFAAVYFDGLTLKGPAGPTPLYLVPGNHDVSNAIGSPTVMVPARDATSMVEMYNRMVRPATPATKDTYDYARQKVIYSRDVAGAHFIFLSMWPDSSARAWIETDLATVPSERPVFLFCHDPPEIDARHLTNPHGRHDVNAQDKFENVVGDIYADALTASGAGKPDGETKVEQRALAHFLHAHPNITAYFHGHANWNEFYTWEGPDHDLALHVFRADSPVKGRNKDDAKTSFQVVVVDVARQKLTSRECLWNSKGARDADDVPVAWSESVTVGIAPSKMSLPR